MAGKAEPGRRAVKQRETYANLLGIDVRVLWLHAFVLWLESEPVLDERSQAAIREARGRVAPPAAG